LPQRSGCDKQHLLERRSGSKIFAGRAFCRVPAPLHPCHPLSLQLTAQTAIQRATQ